MPVDYAAFLKAREYLQDASEDGSSVHNHLYEIFHSLLKGRTSAQPPLHPKTTCKTRFDAEDVSSAERMLGLFKSLPEPQTRTIIERPNPHTTVTTTTIERPLAPPFKDIVSASPYHAICGVGLPPREALAVDLALVSFAIAAKPAELRYFGRVYGTSGYYDIAECRRMLPENTVPPEPYIHTPVEIPSLATPIPTEPPGHGANRWTYAVLPSIRAAYPPEDAPEPSPDAIEAATRAGVSDVKGYVAYREELAAAGLSVVPGTEWVILPDVTPAQIISARQAARCVSGYLTAAVRGHPPFPGVESNLLRAMVCRIASATVVHPSGAVQQYQGESDDEGFDEDGGDGAPTRMQPLTQDVPGFADDVGGGSGIPSYASLSRWVHGRWHVGRNGRVNALPQRPEADEDEEEEEESAARGVFIEANRDDLKPLLEPLSRDDPISKKLPQWTTHSVVPSTCAASSVAIARSVAWPGAVAWCGGGGRDHGCVYFGDGVKRTAHEPFPMLPPQPVTEPEGLDLPLQTDPSAMAEKLVLRGESIDQTPEEEEE